MKFIYTGSQYNPIGTCMMICGDYLSFLNCSLQYSDIVLCVAENIIMNFSH